MHIADPRLGVLGANGDRRRRACRSPSAPALVQQARRRRRVAVAFFGDGAVHPGRVPRGASTSPRSGACRWCSSARTTATPSSPPAGTLTRGPASAERAPATASTAATVDGNDVVAVHERRATRPPRCRAGDGPVLVEAADLPLARPLRGRRRSATSPDGRGAASGSERDPLDVAAAAHGAGRGDRRGRWRVRERGRARGRRGARAWPRALAAPDPEEAYARCLRRHRGARRRAALHGGDQPGPGRRARRATSGSSLSASTSARAAASSGSRAGCTSASAERVIDTPITEMGVRRRRASAPRWPACARSSRSCTWTSSASASTRSSTRRRSCRYMTGGGGRRCPVVFRTQTGAGRSGGAQHSQSLEAMLAHVPGLQGRDARRRVADAHDLLRRRGPRPEPGRVRREPPAVRHEGPPTRRPTRCRSAARASPGPATDVTVVTWGRMVRECLRRAEEPATSRWR